MKISNNLKFELAKIKDLEFINKLYREVIKTTYTTWDNNYPDINMIKENIQTSSLYVLRNDNQIIGVSYITNNIEENKNIGRFARICISLTFQKMGYGTYLCKCVINELKSRNCDEVVIKVDTKNTSALKMYESLGFKNIGDTFAHNNLWYLYKLQL